MNPKLCYLNRLISQINLLETNIIEAHEGHNTIQSIGTLELPPSLIQSVKSIIKVSAISRVSKVEN